ncbi:MAG: hypothetical protein ABEI54_02790 [Candidatus Bipolaricaulia bacterium]
MSKKYVSAMGKNSFNRYDFKIKMLTENKVCVYTTQVPEKAVGNDPQIFILTGLHGASIRDKIVVGLFW